MVSHCFLNDTQRVCIRKVGLVVSDVHSDYSQAKIFAFCFYLIFKKAKSKDLATSQTRLRLGLSTFCPIFFIHCYA
jgi:hypothetical protein